MLKLRVRDLMNTDVKTVGCNDNVATASEIMRHGRIRHLVVIDDVGSLVGVLSQRDFFLGGLMRALGFGSHGRACALDMLIVKEAMAVEVVTTTPDTLASAAAAKMLELKIGCLPVLEGERVVGIITKSDFIALFAQAET